MDQSTLTSPALKAKKPQNAFLKPLTFEFKDLFKALARAAGHTAAGKWEELGTDAVEALSAIGLATTPEELCYVLVKRSLTRALFELLGQSATLLPPEARRRADALYSQSDLFTTESEIYIDDRFLDNPSDTPLVREVQEYLRFWLRGLDVSDVAIDAICQRFPAYFTHALNREWRSNNKTYTPLIDALNTPFTRASDREWAWAEYASLLRQRANENVFDEPFGLEQLFVPLNAYYVEDSGSDKSLENATRSSSKKRVVTSLERELESWLERGDRVDALRVVSGGRAAGNHHLLAFSRPSSRIEA